mgnify:CR=1 FL=1
MKIFRKLCILGILAGMIYFIFNYHVIYYKFNFWILKKSHPTYRYTFVNLYGKDPEEVLSIDELREDGVGDIFLELGLLTERELDRILYLYE